MNANPLPLARATLPELIAEEIIGLIVSGPIEPGTLLPPEGALATRFGVNRLAVREAIRLLEARGALVCHQGRPATVAVPDGRELGAILEIELRTGRAQLADLIDARILIEGELASLAADRRADPAPMAAELAAQAAATERSEFARADVEFHRAVARAAAQPVLALISDSFASLRLRLEAFDDQRPQRSTRESTLAEHQAVITAITQHDPGGARRAMTEHLAQTLLDLTSYSTANSPKSGAANTQRTGR